MILDTPMGANVLDIFRKNREWHKLSEEGCERMCNTFRTVCEHSETQKIINNRNPKIVIAGSGMLTGGRVLTYLQRYLGRPETSILLNGFQAEGTRGRALLEGASELKIHGNYYPVKAEVFHMQALSAHADQAELLDWLSKIKGTPERVFLVHGEPHSADAFRVKLKDVFGWEAAIPELYSIEEVPAQAG